MKIITLEPIGFVSSPVKVGRRGGFSEIRAEINIKDEFVEAINGLGDYSHLEVIYFMHLPHPNNVKGKMKVHPMGYEELPDVGVFATRSPHRPNRIGISLCEVLSVDGTCINVKGLDALDGSPVLDLKGPPLFYYEGLPQLRYPKWVGTLMELRKKKKEGERVSDDV